MTHTVTLIDDHFGQSKPRVKGHEYYVDAVLNINSWADRSVAAFTGTFAGVASAGAGGTLAIDAGGTTWTTLFYPGDRVVIAGSSEGANNTTLTVKSVTDTQLTFTANVTADANETNVTITAVNEYLPASDLGLSEISSLTVEGYESTTHSVRALINADGTRDATDNSYLFLYGKTDSSGSVIANQADIGMVRIRAHGLL